MAFFRVKQIFMVLSSSQIQSTLLQELTFCTYRNVLISWIDILTERKIKATLILFIAAIVTVSGSS